MTPVRTTRDPAGTTVTGASVALGPLRRLISTVVYATPEPARGVLTSTGAASTGTVSAGGVSTGGVSTGGVSTGAVSAGGVSAGGVSAGAAVSPGGGSSTKALGAPRCSRATQPVTSLYCAVTYPSTTWP